MSDDAFGVYVHVPYCQARCPYCDFNVHVVKSPPWEALEPALLAELEARAPVFGDVRARSLYFGGGTPSLAPVALIARLIEAVRARFGEPREVTLEAEPATADAAWLASARRAGVTRLSLGWQSTQDRLLRVLGRGHAAADSRQLFRMARAAGFDNLSVDLIFAVPGQSAADLEADLDALVALGAEHVSLYALTYKEGTEFAARRRAGRLVPIEEEREAAMMERIGERLVGAGFEHYEVSNYARPGRRAVHNALYWTGGRYLGLGPGAHSFHHEAWRRGWRWEGVREPQHYIGVSRGSGLPADDSVSFVETLSERQLLAERMLGAMRLRDGVALAEVHRGAYAAEIEAAVGEGERRGWLVRRGERVAPTELGLMHADALALLFFE